MEFLDRVRSEMERYFGDDQRRIEHALQVTGHADWLLDFIDADPVITLAAAYLHDIGIHQAELRHGSSGGRYQEVEGPPIARRILDSLGADEEMITAVCELVGNHHTPAGVDSPEFRILWDADALVNLAETLPGKSAEEVLTVLERSLVTEPGYRRARKLYLPGR